MCLFYRSFIFSWSLFSPVERKETTIRSSSGSGKGQTLTHIIAAFVFSYYLIGILTMTGIHEFNSFSPRIVFIPLVDMINGPVDTILNIILFLPLGFFVPLLYKRYYRLSRIVLTGFLLSLSIELIQLFGIGATDINDLITNTVGTLLGYFIYKLLKKLTKKELCEEFQTAGISKCNQDTRYYKVSDVLYFYWYYSIYILL